MSEPDVTESRASKHWRNGAMSNGRQELSPSPHRAPEGTIPLVDSLYGERLLPPVPSPPREPESSKAPGWLRPFFSLRIQLTLVYSLILVLVVSCTSILFYRQDAPVPFLLFEGGAVLVGIALAFGFTTVLLRPLWQTTDAVQAIASGDLAQRGRLPVRLPPQDEIDRLAGSIDEMVKQLEYAEEMRRATEVRFSRFFSDASHQLRTPLTSIRGFTELLLRGIKDDAEMLPRILTRMKGETERMTNLIADLLTISRLDHTYPVRTKYFDLIELALESVEQARSRATDERKISLQIATERRVGIQGDRERMKQLLFILLDNALKYGRPAPDGMITLKLDRQGGQAEVWVIDNGEGIAEEDQVHIFDAFYRGRRRATGSAAAGAGLGLTIAAAIARIHSGTITVESQPGCGAQFKVILPAID